MKKIFLIAIFAIFIFAGCSSTNENIENTENETIKNNTENETIQTESLTEEETSKEEKIEFNKEKAKEFEKIKKADKLDSKLKDFGENFNINEKLKSAEVFNIKKDEDGSYDVGDGNWLDVYPNPGVLNGDIANFALLTGGASKDKFAPIHCFDSGGKCYEFSKENEKMLDKVDISVIFSENRKDSDTNIVVSKLEDFKTKFINNNNKQFIKRLKCRKFEDKKYNLKLLNEKKLKVNGIDLVYLKFEISPKFHREYINERLSFTKDYKIYLDGYFVIGEQIVKGEKFPYNISFLRTYTSNTSKNEFARSNKGLYDLIRTLHKVDLKNKD